jgi:hypothetical protein
MDDYTVRVETVDLGQLAREEVDAAREQGVDPLDLARTHERTAALIRRMVAEESA